MKSEKIRRAIGGIDDDIIEDADRVKVSGSNKRIWVRRAVIAAAAVLLLAGAIVLPGVLKQNAPVVDKLPEVKNNGKTGAETVPIRPDAQCLFILPFCIRRVNGFLRFCGKRVDKA